MKTNSTNKIIRSNNQNKFLFMITVIAILFISLLAFNSNGEVVTKASADSDSKTCENCKGYDKETKFNLNTTFMKDAAVDYFTNERLPQSVNSKVKITLGEMIEKKLLYTITDSNGETCSLNDSYVEVTKYESEYVFKIKLSCNDVSDYILVHKGCADYCGDNQCVVPEPDDKTYEYEYKKTQACVMTDWSDWSEWTNVREEIKNSNLKREEIRTESITVTETEEVDADTNINYSCEKYGDQYELLGTVCVKVNSELLEEEAEKNPTTYNCDSYDGYELVEGTTICKKVTTTKDEQPAEKNPTTYNCDAYDDYELVEGTTTCKKVTTTRDEQPAEKNPTTYNCDKYDSSYELNQETHKCVKDISEHDTQDASPIKHTVHHDKTCTRTGSCKRWIAGTGSETVCDDTGCHDVPGTAGHWEYYACREEYDCSYDEDVIVGYNCDKYGADYELNEDTKKCVKNIEEHDIKDAEEDEPTYNCDKYDGYDLVEGTTTCLKVTVEEDEKEADEDDATYNCDKYDDEYELEGEVCVKETVIEETEEADEDEVTYNCDKYEGYEVVGNKCVKAKCDVCTKDAEKEEEKVCKEGYTLNGEVCTREVEKQETVTEYRYSTRLCVGGGSDTKWSLDKNDSELTSVGFKRTGRTRLFVITK